MLENVSLLAYLTRKAMSVEVNELSKGLVTSKFRHNFFYFHLTIQYSISLLFHCHHSLLNK